MLCAFSHLVVNLKMLVEWVAAWIAISDATKFQEDILLISFKDIHKLLNSKFEKMPYCYAFSVFYGLENEAVPDYAVLFSTH